MAKLIKTQDAQPLGAYIPTSLDARKAEADANKHYPRM